MLDQVEERLLAPLQVVEDDHQRPVCRGVLERLAERPGDLVRRRRRVRLTQQRADRHRGRLVRRQDVELFQHLDHRPVGDPLPIGQTAATGDRGVEGSQSLRGESRLAHARVTGDRDHLAAVLGPHALPCLAQDRELVLTAHEQPTVGTFRRGMDAQYPKGRNRRGLPFSSSGPTGSTSAAACTKARVGSPISTSPGCAACCSRAATLTASPVASCSSTPVTTSPVMTPIRPCNPSSGSASRISTAACTARSASSSCSTGTPNTAITASPMNFSTLPPCRSTIPFIRSK